MFDIKKGDVTGTTNRLLFNIWQELIKLNEAKPEIPLCQPAGGIKDKPKQAKPTKPTKQITCRICGEQFENQGVFLAHMREHKKEAENGN